MFNLNKTEIKPVRPDLFRSECFDLQLIGGHTFSGARILAPSDPIQVLGIWIGDEDLATFRWLQIETHISHIIKQWSSMMISILNWVLIAKSLMLSRCYYLLDG